MLKQVFGTDQITFKDCGTTLPAGSRCDDPMPVMRTYTSFTQAADENAYSRVLVGFHFRKATKKERPTVSRLASRQPLSYLRVEKQLGARNGAHMSGFHPGGYCRPWSHLLTASYRVRLDPWLLARSP